MDGWIGKPCNYSPLGSAGIKRQKPRSTWGHDDKQIKCRGPKRGRNAPTGHGKPEHYWKGSASSTARKCIIKADGRRIEVA